jgi:hypothetical protein
MSSDDFRLLLEKKISSEEYVRRLRESSMVTDEMVERAARALQRRYEETGEDIRSWDSPEIDDETRDAYREDARLALKAAFGGVDWRRAA